MIIGIDASRAFLPERTGIEEYSYRVIENLAKIFPGDVRVILYVKKIKDQKRKQDFVIPANWEVCEVGWKRLWTQGGLAWEMFRRPADVLFVPAHTVPWIHPKKTVVTIHGLEYEKCPEGYTFWERAYMRFSIRMSCRWASSVVAVSENTKRDLVSLYGIPERKIQIISEGIAEESGQEKNAVKVRERISSLFGKKYIVSIGRVEERKNMRRIIEAFDILKKEFSIPHNLVFAGKDGYGARVARKRAKKSPYRDAIVFTGYVGEEEKRGLLRNAEALIFPSLYEGFGLPILEAQAEGVVVVTSNISSLPEVAGGSAMLVDPYDVRSIAEGIYTVLSDKETRSAFITMGFRNVRRFSWSACARRIARILLRG